MLYSTRAHRILSATKKITALSGRTAHRMSTSASQQQAFTIIGGGRIGQALAEMSPSSIVIKRGEPIKGPAGPIVVCTRNDDLPAIVESTPLERRKDLVFIQNGMLQPWLDSVGLGSNTQVLVYFAVAKKGEKPTDGKTDVNPEGLTAAHGEHAEAVAALLHSGGLSCKVLEKVPFKRAMLEKLVWISAFMLVGVKHSVTVGEVEKNHKDEVSQLIRELASSGQADLGIVLDAGYVERLLAYARSVAHFPTAIKEFAWRNGWFHGITRQQLQSGQEDPMPMHTALLMDVGAVQKGGWSKSRRSAVSVKCAATPKKVLLMGGTRFIGLYLARQLVEQGHDVTLFTRGKKDITAMIPDDDASSYANFKASIKHIKGDRMEFDNVKATLAKEKFQVVYDINGRESAEARPVLEGARATLEQYIYCSSAGVYLKSDQMPHRETDATDVKSRHKGKLDTESYLQEAGVAWTSIRPVYIYGPLNYNPVEEWFFHRIKAGRPIPVPGSGMQVTQLGHVKDLATAFVKAMGNPKAYNQIYNLAGERYVTFDGIAKACAKAAGAPEPELIHYNAKDFDFGKEKPFPLRDQHFFTSVDKAMADLDWKPEFGLLDGLKDSYSKDFGRGTFRKAADFTCDDMILAKAKGKVLSVV